MVSTRRAQTSPTPPVTPSAPRHEDAPPGSSKKMSREMRRLAIDANPKLGGSTSSSGKRSRRSDVHAQSQPPSAQPPPPNHLLPDAQVLLTPSPSDPPNSPHLRSTNDAAQDAPNRLPAPLLSPSTTQPPPQTSNPQDTAPVQSISTPAKPSMKRKSTIEHYFRALPPQPESNKRRKIDSPAPQFSGKGLHKLSEPSPAAVPQSDTDRPVEAPAQPETTSEKPQQVVQLQNNPIEGEEQTAAEPEKPPEKEQENKNKGKQKEVIPAADDIYLTAEEEHGNTVTDDRAETPEQQKAKAKKERELRRLQIDANPALTGDSPPRDERGRSGSKRLRRQTTLPPASEHVDVRPSKRARHSLPAVASSSAAIAGPSSAAIAGPSSDAMADASPIVIADDAPEVENDASSYPIPGLTFEQRLSFAPIPNPPVFPAGTDPKLLASGEVSDAWLTQWLGYVALITGDKGTSKLLEEDAKHLIKPDRSNETEEERQKRIQREVDIMNSWPIAADATTDEVQEVEAPSTAKGKKKTKGKKATVVTAKGKGKAKVV